MNYNIKPNNVLYSQEYLSQLKSFTKGRYYKPNCLDFKYYFHPNEFQFLKLFHYSFCEYTLGNP